MKIIERAWAAYARRREQEKTESLRSIQNRDILKIINALSPPALSKEEEEKIHHQWGRFPFQPYADEFRLYKLYAGFDARFVSQDLQYTFLYDALNPKYSRTVLSDKGMYGVWLHQMPQPATVICRIGGVFFDSERKVIDTEKASRLLLSQERCIIKPILDTNQGKGIHIFTPQEKTISRVFEWGGSDFIIQGIVGQSPVTAKFHSSSLNTFRVTTLFLNGVISVSSICFKFARGESQVDNLGHGGLIVGVEENGQFHDFGLDKDYQKCLTFNNGEKISEICIPEVKKVVDFAKSFHPYYFPRIALVGWDIALDSNNNPLLIEANLITPGIMAEQYCSQKPAYGDRTDEVIEYVLSKKRKRI